MRFKKTDFEGLFIIKSDIHKDERGSFSEVFRKDLFSEYVPGKINFCQTNIVKSNYMVLRGLHYQIEPKPQGKLVRCVSGSVFDVAIDIRKSSSTFGEWTSVVLDNISKLMIWIPVGFAFLIGILLESCWSCIPY